jgi:hypothetical protein
MADAVVDRRDHVARLVLRDNLDESRIASPDLLPAV